jgi:hypothetical protein
MRQYNMAWQQVVELLNQMSVVVGDGTPYSWSISADQQWLQVFLVDDPLVADILQVTVDLAPVIPDTPLPAPSALTLTSIEPTTAAIGDPDFMLIATGEQFNPTTQLLINGVAVETIPVSAVELATVVDPDLAPGFGALPVQVQDGTTIAPPSPSSITLTITSSTKVTSATAGTPGAWAPVGNTLPANFAALDAAVPAITAAPATAWVAGQYVVLGDLSEASWNGTDWVVGRAVATVLMAAAAPTAPPPPAEEPAPEEAPV